MGYLEFGDEFAGLSIEKENTTVHINGWYDGRVDIEFGTMPYDEFIKILNEED